MTSDSVAGLVFCEEINLLILQRTMLMQARHIGIEMAHHAAQLCEPFASRLLNN
jgi:hypothetical protein